MLRIAIVGAGAISDSHLQAYLGLRDRCRIVALVDLFPEKAGEKLRKYGLEARVYTHYDELLRAEAFDAASVCLPPFEHAPACLALLRAGCHVLVEKPLATSLEECDEILATAEQSGRVVSVVAQNRFKTPMMRLKRVLESGLLGKLLHAQVDSFWWRGSNYYDLWWRGTWAKEGGGCTMNHAVHHIDLFQWMMGMPHQLQAVTANLAHENSEVEDFSTAILSYATGAIGQITASLIHHGEEQQLVFQGERAQAAVPWQVKAMRPKENGFPEEDLALQQEIEAFYQSLPAVAREGHDGQIGNFVAAIEGTEPLAVDGQQGRQTLELITAIYQSGQLGQPVSLPLTERDPFYTRAGVLAHAKRFHEKTKNVENFASNEITLGRDYSQ